MPETFAQWLWFAFFSVGSLGGWVLVSVYAADLWQRWRR
jgi:hypothetical protein